jgi:hypothetical protein
MWLMLKRSLVTIYNDVYDEHLFVFAAGLSYSMLRTKRHSISWDEPGHQDQKALNVRAQKSKLPLGL